MRQRQNAHTNFRKHRYLTEHFEKHGDEFPYDTEKPICKGANNVINNPDALHKLEKERRGRCLFC